MTLQKKTQITIALTLAGLLFVLYGAARLLVLRGFDEHDMARARQFMGLVRSAYMGYVARLDENVLQYSAWDDTVNFVQAGGDEYIRSNFVDTTFKTLRLSAVLIFDNAGRTVFEKGFDLVLDRPMPVPEGLRAHLEPGSPLLAHDGPESVARGMLLLPEGPMLVVSRPIVDSDQKGSPHGVLVMARFSEPDVLRRVGSLFQTDPRLFGVDATLPEECRRAVDAMTDGETTMHFQPVDAMHMACYALINDIYGRPTLLLRMTVPRDAHQGKLIAQRMLLVSLLAAGLVFGLVFVLLLERLVLARVANLNRAAREISRSGDSTRRVPVLGADELGDLAGSINEMLGALDASRGALLESEETARALMNATRDSAFLVDLNGVIVSCNEIAARRLGMSVAEIAGANLNDVFPPPVARSRMARVITVARTGKPVQFEDTRSGLVFDAIMYPVFGPGGEVDRVAIFARDITEYRRAEQALRDSERLYRELVQGVNCIVLRWDPQGRITFMNEFGLAFFGHTAEALLGKSVVETIVPGSESSGRDLSAMIADLLARPEQYSINENENIRADGRRVWVAWSNRPLFDEDGRLREILSIGIDISRRKEAETALLHRVQMEELVAWVSARFLNLTAGRLADGVVEALEAVGKYIGAERGYVYLVRRDGSTADLVYEWCAPGVSSLERDTRGIRAADLPWFVQELLRSGHVHIASLDTLPEDASREKAFFGSHGIKSLVDVALMLEEQPFGVWGFSSLTAFRQWSNEDINLLKVLGQVLVAALQRARAEQTLMHRAEMEELVADLSSSFLNLPPEQFEAGVHRGLRAIGEFAGADHAGIFELRPEKRRADNIYEWHAAGVESQLGSLRDIQFDAFPWFARSVRNFEVVHVPDTGRMPPEAAADRDQLEHRGILSLLAVPMAWQGSLFGVFVLDCVRARRAWSDEDKNLFRIIAQLFVTAFQRRRAEAELLLQKSRLETLVELEQMTDVAQDDMINSVLRAGVRLTRSEFGVIGIVEPGGASFQPYFWSERADESPLGNGSVMPLSPAHRDLWSEVVHRRKPIVINKYSRVSLARKGEPGAEVAITRFLAVPILDGDRVEAVAAVANKEDKYDQADANQLTLLMNGAWNHLRRRKAADWIQREVDEIASLQRGLLPPRMPEIHGMTLAVAYATFDRAGGDFYDILPVGRPFNDPPDPGHRRWLVAIADASGHGPSAAVVMAMLSSLLRSYHRAPDHPSEVLAYLNNHLAERSIYQSFVTAFLAVVDLDDLTLTYSSAGHNMPLLRDSDGRVQPLESTGGVPLGIHCDLVYPERSWPLKPGQTLLLFTDGVVESKSPDGALFGEDRLRQAFETDGHTPDATVERLVRRLRDFEAGQRPADDQTMMVIHID